jgi:hypothetical protein
MILTPKQASNFWRQWQSIVRLNAWGPVEAEIQRHALLRRAGFDSLTKVDKLSGYDSVLAELAALGRPDDHEAQMREANMPRKRLLFSIGRLSTPLSPARAPLSYACALAKDKYGTSDLELLLDDQLLKLRNTLAARLCAHRARGRDASPRRPPVAGRDASPGHPAEQLAA